MGFPCISIDTGASSRVSARSRATVCLGSLHARSPPQTLANTIRWVRSWKRSILAVPPTRRELTSWFNQIERRMHAEPETAPFPGGSFGAVLYSTLFRFCRNYPLYQQMNRRKVDGNQPIRFACPDAPVSGPGRACERAKIALFWGSGISPQRARHGAWLGVAEFCPIFQYSDQRDSILTDSPLPRALHGRCDFSFSSS